VFPPTVHASPDRVKRPMRSSLDHSHRVQTMAGRWN
jgi:hypothetical protein